MAIVHKQVSLVHHVPSSESFQAYFWVCMLVGISVRNYLLFFQPQLPADYTRNLCWRSLRTWNFTRNVIIWLPPSLARRSSCTQTLANSSAAKMTDVSVRVCCYKCCVPLTHHQGSLVLDPYNMRYDWRHFAQYCVQRRAVANLRIMPSSGMLRRVALVRFDVSEERNASILKVTRIGDQGTTLSVTRNRHMLTLFLVHRFVWPWWWRRYVPPKRRCLQEPHGRCEEIPSGISSQCASVASYS
jgi:hypothetical protein